MVVCREFLQYLQIPVITSDEVFHDNSIHLDAEWMTVLSRTHYKLLSTKEGNKLGDEFIEIPTKEVSY